LHRAARSSFADPRLQQWLGRYATYSGSSPYRAPATLACIAHVESEYGCWYTMGGLGAVRDALACSARRLAVEVRTECDVVAIVADEHRVRGVELASGEQRRADVLVAGVDAEHLYADLLPDRRNLRRVRRAGRSTSGFVLCLGVRGTTPGIAHHNVWFAADARAEFDAIARGQLAADATIYASVPTVTDASRAPAGCESWFVMVNAPAGCDIDPDTGADCVLDLLAARGPDLRDRIEVRLALTPTDFAARYRSPGGAIYGTSSDGRRAAFARPVNRGPRRGLYLAGGSSHPGGGLPLVAISGRIVADLVRDDLASGVVT
jgi:phytoene desaturase